MSKWVDALGAEIGIGDEIIFFTIVDHTIVSSRRIVYEIGECKIGYVNLPYIKAYHIGDKTNIRDGKITNLYNCVVIQKGE